MHLEILCEDRIGLTHEVLELLVQKKLDLRGIEIDVHGKVFLDCTETDFDQFSDLMTQIRHIQGVQDVRTIQSMPAKCHRHTPVSASKAFERFVGQSSKHKAMINQAKKLSLLEQPLLILGETGTGKEMLARACHDSSPRFGQPFLVLSCASMPDDVVETELFGHAPGAFNQQQGNKGLFELANGGTIFLDEIGEMSPHLQSKLVRFLQDGTFRRVGEEAEIHVDIRVIAATNYNLAEMVDHRNFREDLYFRLNVLNLTIPPLRKRSSDVIPLVDYFATKHSQQLGIDKPNFSDDALEMLLAYQWPGNIRELDSLILRVLSLHEHGDVDAKMLALEVHSTINSCNAPIDVDSSLDELMKAYEAKIISSLYQAFPSSRKLAKRLNVSHTSIANKLREYGINQ